MARSKGYENVRHLFQYHEPNHALSVWCYIHKQQAKELDVFRLADVAHIRRSVR